MIIGLGTDLADVRRIEASLTRFGGRFTARICTSAERSRADRRPNRVNAYAMLFAAKEACSKALGTGFRKGVYWRDMEVRNHPSGKPYILLSGGARKRLDELTPAGMTALVDLSLTDEYPFAQATVIISAVPPDLAAKRLD